MRYANFFLVVAVTIVGLLVAETGYRVWVAAKLYLRWDPVAYDSKPSFIVYNPPPWSFDRETGFGYVPNLTWWTAQITEGRFTGCTQPAVMTNEQGNIGTIFGAYKDADVKILVFGDSFTTMSFNGTTWPNLFQRKVEKALGKNVHVVNFGRDSYGMLQMADLAAREVPRWKPDYVVIAFITNDLRRLRYWRVIKKVGPYWRFFAATKPDENIEPDVMTTNDVAIINPDVTQEWCKALTAKIASGDHKAARSDPLVPALVDQYNSIRRENARPLLKPEQVNFYSVKASFLYNRIVKHETFAGVAELPKRVGYRQLDMDTFKTDEHFNRVTKKLRESGAKVLLVHLPVREEIESGREYLWKQQAGMSDAEGELMLRDIENAFGIKTIELLRYVTPPIADFTSYVHSATDSHPNRKGIDFYSDIVLKAILEVCRSADHCSSRHVEKKTVSN